jgi:hypothetical protein
MNSPAKPLTASMAVLALVGALVLCTVAGAGAAAVTPKVVKKIAAKVVNKKAKTLSVAHASTATTATTADKVGGATADQLRTTEYRYTISAIGPTGSVSYAIPNLPSGSYTVGYWYRAATTAAGGLVSCDLTPSPSDFSTAESFGVTNGAGTSRGSASGTVTTTTGPMALFCSVSAGNLTMFGQISFVRVDTLVPGAAIGS